MNIVEEAVKSINTMYEGGSAPLSEYKFQSHELAQKQAQMLFTNDRGDIEKDAQFRMNQTGNIFYVSTSPELIEKTKKLFDSVTVLFAAMTAGLNACEKSLFDYDTWRSVIGKSGFFVEVQKTRNMMTIKNSGVTVNTQIVQQLLPGLTSGSAMEIAKGVLSAVNGEFQASERAEEAKIGHLLFICEELFGAPSVTVRLFFASKKSHSTFTNSPCHKSVSTTFEQLQEANTVMTPTY